MAKRLTNKPNTMNNIFNIKRFGKLLKQQYHLSKKSATLSLLSLFIGYTLITLFTLMADRHFDAIQWVPLFIILCGGVALPFAAYAFPAFRNKGLTFDFILLPCSLIEKFTLNLIVRILSPWLILPLVFYVSSHLASELVLWFSPDRFIESFSFTTILQEIGSEKLPFILTLTILIALIAQSVLFAGGAVFGKKPLIKTLVILGATTAVVIFYFFSIIEWAELFKNGRVPWLIIFDNKESTAKALVVGIEIFVLITTWAYAFFRVKEKQIA
ncbi:hypothetical protein [Carboxylicivirga sp. N1Y90]|uniref:hypothetical protein n=1 Tax=Carboxylicivirga fragile TaxID=3417571 RepID=UPI003D33FD4C|nr:hypothetical protein [Marinilabiliaceae bacterium N1Y90]